uniref:Dehydrogenase reductase sdr family protein 7-like protein n=1 Tax=Pseudodiaptomus poplesia TaxID=213370 RepID=A0A1S6GL78_9MAXI|nr:dehydrogenase reductase sdr family protein 7-like protein [Pseudodiaptomus poplesia]
MKIYSAVQQRLIMNPGNLMRQSASIAKQIIPMPKLILDGFLDWQIIGRCDDLVGKVVLVTGASSGIGRELATHLYMKGARVILAARSTDKLRELEDYLYSIRPNPENNHNQPQVLTLDLEDVEDLKSKAEEALSIYGGIDILINCGGISVRGGAIETDLDVYRRLMEINFFGTVKLTAVIAQDMKNRGSGQIVMISSMQGRLAIPDRAAYAASKHALQAYSDSLRAELSQFGVHVLVVSPGYVKTNLSMNALTASGQTYSRMDDSTAKGYEVDYVAEQIVKSIVRKKKEVVLSTLLHRLAILIRTFFPSLYFYLMARRANKDTTKTGQKDSKVAGN